MRSIYALSPPLGLPSVQRSWSFSELVNWRTCPRGWYLQRAQYEGNDLLRYPCRYSISAVFGIVVHAVVETYLQGNPENQRLRQIASEKLLHEIELICKSNPRMRAADLIGRIRVTDVVNSAKRLIYRYEDTDQGPHFRSTRAFRDVSTPGQDDDIRLGSIKLKGRFDIVRDGNICDLKTGTPKDRDTEQLRFYALLFWLKHKTPPSSLRLVYDGDKGSVSLPPPSEDDLRAVANTLSREIEEIETTISAGLFNTNPDAEVCRQCGVRQLCDEYWRNLETIGSRVEGLACEVQAHVSQRVDCEFDGRTADFVTTPHGIVASVPKTAQRGPYSVRLPAYEVWSAYPVIRVLSARVILEPAGVHLLVDDFSEMFYGDQPV